MLSWRLLVMSSVKSCIMSLQGNRVSPWPLLSHISIFQRLFKPPDKSAKSGLQALWILSLFFFFKCWCFHNDIYILLCVFSMDEKAFHLVRLYETRQHLLAVASTLWLPLPLVGRPSSRVVTMNNCREDVPILTWPDLTPPNTTWPHLTSPTPETWVHYQREEAKTILLLLFCCVCANNSDANVFSSSCDASWS